MVSLAWSVLSHEFVRPHHAFTNFNLAIADDSTSFLVGRLCHRQLSRPPHDRSSGPRGIARPDRTHQFLPSYLCLVAQGTGACHKTGGCVEHHAKFNKLTPTAFIAAMTKSGNSQADCRTFAETSQTDITNTVASLQSILNAVDTGAGCANEGQAAVTAATTALTNANAAVVTAQAAVVTAQAAQTTACTAVVTLRALPLDALEAELTGGCAAAEAFITGVASTGYTTVKAACTQATTALAAAQATVVTNQATVVTAQATLDTAVTTAARLMDACLCRVKSEQATAWENAGTSSAANAVEWKKSHEIICALDQTTSCTVPTCPTVTQPQVAAGVADATCGTPAPTPAPTSQLTCSAHAVTGAALHSDPASSLGVTWIVSPGPNAASGQCGSNCNAVCNSFHGSSCVREGLRLVTLPNGCDFQMAATGSIRCQACGPSDSTNAYCFPGQSAQASTSYYHTSWSSSSFTCNTNFDRELQTLCPCTLQ